MYKILLFTFISTLFLSASYSQTRVITGAERFLNEYVDSVQYKNIGIVTNHSAILPNGVHLIDSLLSINKVKIKALFGPEHGLSGNAADGKKISDGFYKNTTIPVYSLYGNNIKPNAEMLDDIEIMIFDIQDIGARFYTFISTLYYTIEACAENEIKLIVLDRPNPIGGLYIDGPVLDNNLKSFVGIIDIPITHGMTIGELALLMNNKYFSKRARLKIIPMLNWKRNMYFDECGLTWIKPSPNIVNVEAELVYPGICLIEGTNISEGRGTYLPFLQVGAPFINSMELASELKKLKIKGVIIDTISFTPTSIPEMSDKPKYLGQKCFGVKFKITNREEFKAVKLGISIISTIYKLYPDKLEFKNSINRLYGKKTLQNDLQNANSTTSIYDSWSKELQEFILLRKNYLIY